MDEGQAQRHARRRGVLRPHLGERPADGAGDRLRRSITTLDPAAGLFTTTNFQGASAAQLTDARALYAMLTGRVRAITGQAALDEETNKYVAFGPRRRAGNMDEYSAFVQDSWRMTPTLTLNAGLRWDVQLPFAPSTTS